jgi:hypothetical protein
MDGRCVGVGLRLRESEEGANKVYYSPSCERKYWCHLEIYHGEEHNHVFGQVGRSIPW